MRSVVSLDWASSDFLVVTSAQGAFSTIEDVRERKVWKKERDKRMLYHLHHQFLHQDDTAI